MSNQQNLKLPKNQAQIFPQPYPSAPCDMFNCTSRAKYFIGRPDGPMNILTRICEKDLTSIIKSIPDHLLPEIPAIAELEEHLDSVYSERNKCVALIAQMALSMGLTAGIGKHPAEDAEWEDDWRNIIFIDLPAGQCSWHIHDSEIPLFSFLPEYAGKWDGHDTEEKYRRVLDPVLPPSPLEHMANLEKQVLDLREQLSAANTSGNVGGSNVNGIPCPYCGEIFPNARAMGGHKGSCPKKPKKEE